MTVRGATGDGDAPTDPPRTNQCPECLRALYDVQEGRPAVTWRYGEVEEAWETADWRVLNTFDDPPGTRYFRCVPLSTPEDK